MPVDRPTFSESWYRVSNLSPRLRSTVQVHRQYYRGQMWHVVQDPSSNQFFRLNDAAYYFVAMLDGRKTVGEVWRLANEELGDAAPTQGEAIQLLGQLYTSNLLQAELPPDAEGLFQRHSKRVQREVRGYLTNLLFIRIPLIDPDRFLERWVGVVGWIFSWIGLAMWAVLLSVGGYYVVQNWGELVNQVSNFLSRQQLAANLPMLYASFVVAKAFHEFAHGFACKKFGRQTGTGGEVHTMGIMFLVFMPLPYVDASSMWAFRSKWQRVAVGTAGMFVELGVAAVAAILWANTSGGTTLHVFCYNLMFIASVSTLLFNGNPLLRYDGYYILSDLLEIPNLWQRSRQYIYYTVRRYVWRVRQARNPAHTGGEKFWLFAYGVASTVYRVFIVTAILMFVIDRFFFIGLVLAVGAIATWLFVPLGKFIHYLATSGELSRVRGWAVASTLLFVALVIGGIALIPAPDNVRFEGVVEPTTVKFVHTETSGFVEEVLAQSNADVTAGTPLVRLSNPELNNRRDKLLAERRLLEVQREKARAENEGYRVQSLDRQLRAQERLLEENAKEIERLTVRAPVDGTWVSPDLDRLPGIFLERGERVGLVASLDSLIIRGVSGQDIAAAIRREALSRPERPRVEMRVRGRPDLMFEGVVESMDEAGRTQLPSRALGYSVGGTVATDPEDQQGTQTVEQFFEIRIEPQSPEKAHLLSGERVVVRLPLESKPLALRWMRAILQMVLKRFHV